MVLDVVDETRDVEDAIWNLCLELRFPREHNDWPDSSRWQEVQAVLNSAQVPVVLEDWVLELKLSFEQNLCPGRLLGISEYPSFIVLILMSVQDELIYQWCS